MSEPATAPLAAPPAAPPAAATEAAAPSVEEVATGPTMLGGEQTSTPAATTSTAVGTWRETLDDKTRDDPSVSRYNSMQDAVNGLISANGMIGHDSVVKPRNDSPEEMQRYHSDLGAPADAADYDFTDMKADGILLDSDDWVLKGMREVFKGQGVLNGQARGIMEGFNEVALAQEKEVEVERAAATAAGTAAVKQEWGSAYEGNRVLAERACKAIFGDDMFEELANAVGDDGVQFGSKKEFLLALHNIGTQMGEDSMESGDVVTARTPASAQAEIDALWLDDDFNKVMFNLNDPKNAAYQQKLSDLQDEALGGTKV